MFIVVQKSVETNPTYLKELATLRRHMSSHFISDVKKSGYKGRLEVVQRQLKKFYESVHEYLLHVDSDSSYEVKTTTSLNSIVGMISGYQRNQSYFILKEGKNTHYVAVNTVYSISVIEMCNSCRKEFSSHSVNEGLCIKCEEQEDGI